MGWREECVGDLWGVIADLEDNPQADDVVMTTLRRVASVLNGDRIALARELLAGTGRVVAERKLLTAAHACMRETGWQLAPAHAARGSDGVLEAACAEVDAQFGELLGDTP